jgi:CHAT domain-containing protein
MGWGTKYQVACLALFLGPGSLSQTKDDPLLRTLQDSVSAVPSPSQEGEADKQVISTLSRFFILQLGHESGRAREAYEQAVAQNGNVANRSAKARNDAALLATGMTYQVQINPDELFGNTRVEAALRWGLESKPEVMSIDWQLRKIFQYEGQLGRRDESIPLGDLVQTLCHAYDQFDGMGRSPLQDRAQQAHLLLLLEQQALRAHFETLDSRREIAYEPYSSILQAWSAAFARLRDSPKEIMIEMEFAEGEELINKNDLKNAGYVYRFAGEILDSDKKSFPSRTYLKVKCQLQTANWYSQTGQYNTAKVLLDSAAEQIPAIADETRRLEMSGYHGRYLGQVLLAETDYVGAARSYQKSIDSFAKIENLNIVGSWGELALTYMAEDKYNDAVEAARTGLALKTSYGNRYGRTAWDIQAQALHLALIQSYYFLKNYSQMRLALDDGLDSVKSPLMQALMQIYSGKFAIVAGGGCADAISHFRHALDQLGSNNQSSAGEIANLDMARCQNEVNGPLAALPFAEMAVTIDRNLRKLSRGSAAYDALLEGSGFNNLGPFVLRLLYDALKQANFKDVLLQQKLLFYAEVVRSRGIVDEIESMRRGISYTKPGVSESDIELLGQAGLSELFTIYPVLTAKPADVLTTFEQYMAFVQSLAARHGIPAVLLEYVPIEERDRILLFIVQKSSIQLVELKRPWSEVVKNVQTIRDNIQLSLEKYRSLRASPNVDSAIVSEIAQLERALDRNLVDIGDVLVASVSDIGNLGDICRGKSVVIVPYGALHNLPFAAVRVRSSQGVSYLVDVAARISNSPSATLLQSILRDYKSNLETPVTNMLFVGDSTDPSLNVADELAAIRTAFKRVTNTSEKSNLKPTLRSHSAAHFAVHGFFDRASVWDSGLALKDGVLTLEEITGLEIFRTRVVTMAACETGQASVSSGDEVWSLATGFVFAGVPAVVSAQWKQDNEAAREFYARFYEALATKRSIGVAFRNSMLAVRGLPDWIPRDQADSIAQYASPCFWAGFHFLGE